MSERSTTHGTFVIERTYDATPARVFAAWADPEIKMQWLSCHEGAEYTHDFRTGGREVYRGGPAGGPIYANETHYQNIVPNERIIYTYTMHRDDTPVSVSVVTIEFKAAGSGTHLIFTEQGVFLDGHDHAAQREHGTEAGFGKLDALLHRQAIKA